MVTLTLKVRVLPEKRKELLQTILSMLECIRKEKGCLSHSWYRNLEDENTFILLEEWQTHEDLERYVHSDGFRILLGAIRILGEYFAVYLGGSCGDASIELAGQMRDRYPPQAS